MKHNYLYLKDSEFLDFFDRERLKEQYAKLTVLTFDEKPIESIEGRVISGSLNLDGSSSIRRTCNITVVADEYENDLTNVDNIISLNKKVDLEIGFINNTSYYTQYPMIWFPMGTYVIITPNISYNATGVASISLQLKDKMCLLNGECGGTIPSSVTFHEYDTIDTNGNYVTLKPTIYQIIQELVNHWGGEQLSKIIISDVDTRIKQVMKWTGSSPFYLIEQFKDGTTQYTGTMNPDSIDNDTVYKVYEYGMDVGYIYTDFVYTDELISDAGNSVCDILDKIKNYLGNYEYYYDVEGNFIFQEIKNYLNTSQATVELDKMTKDDYLIDQSKGKAVYVFDDSNMITAYTNAPQYSMIKNDFVVWGTRTDATGLELPCRYHLSIDKKPKVGNTYKVFFYTDPDDNTEKAKCPMQYPTKADFPTTGMAEVFYLDVSTGIVYAWDTTDLEYVEITDHLEDITTTDWRTELYLSGTCAEPFGKDSNYYFTELKNEWPKIYDIRNGKFYDETLKYPYDIDFFLDFIDSGAAISEFNISNIGRRTKSIVDNDINCVFEPYIPDLVMLRSGDPDLTAQREECNNRGQDYIQLDDNLYSLLLGGGNFNSAYNYVRELLYQYTSYNESINLTAIPIFYLEPNTRITVRNNQSGIFGDYMINSISIPLDVSSTMTISATRALERI